MTPLRRALLYWSTWRRLSGRRDAADLPALVAQLARPTRPDGLLVHSMQKPSEIERLLARLRTTPPRVVVEIGTASGGTLLFLSRAAAPEARIFSIDLPRGPFGGGYHPWRIPLYKSFAGERQKITLFRADSHSAATAERLRRELAGDPVDFLFIDGDHTYEGVRRDFELYSPLVRSGGLVAFHDIVPDPGQPGMQVGRYWASLRGRYESAEYVDSAAQSGYGIGILVMP